MVERKLVEAPVVPLLAVQGRSSVFLLLFFCDFRCGALLFMVVHVVCGCKNR